jgi:hypothetical protein
LVLRCAAGETATAIARDLHVIKYTVGKWRGRFVAPTTDGMLDELVPVSRERLPTRTSNAY